MEVKGVFDPPRTEATQRGNLAKAVEALRSHPTISRRFLGDGAVDRLLAADRGWLLGVLEDARRAHDGLPPKSAHDKPGSSADKGPYLGLRDPVARRAARGRRKERVFAAAQSSLRSHAKPTAAKRAPRFSRA